MWTVLVVDDDSLILSTVRRTLERRDFHVTVALTVQQALTELDRTTFDLVLTDLTLGDRSGMDVLRALVGREHRTASILMSALVDDWSRALALELGASAVVEKPFSARDLAASLTLALPALERP